jgi:hypothetical protein
MNATVRLRDLKTGAEETYTLVYPDEADIEANRLSILAPIGTALLGYRAGDVVEWPVPAGITRFRIEEVLFQPRSARARRPVSQGSEAAPTPRNPRRRRAPSSAARGTGVLP